MAKVVIGIIGPIGAGKDTAGDYCADILHIPKFQISAPLKMICAERGIEPVRENLIALGTKVAKQGDGFLAEYLLDRAPQRSIITGLRQLGQLAVLRSSADFTLISVDSTPETRFDRVRQNPKPGEAETLEEFIRREEAENSPPNAQRLFECMTMADYTLRNDGTLNEFHAALAK